MNWSLPYSVGPPHMEKDKSGVSVICFDCCVHPQAVELSSASHGFKDLLIKTALDGVEEKYRRQSQTVRNNL